MRCKDQGMGYAVIVNVDGIGDVQKRGRIEALLTRVLA